MDELGNWLYPDSSDAAFDITVPIEGSGAVSPETSERNLGETQILTTSLHDQFGNPIMGRQVEWFMQGVGYFVTDDENTISDPSDPAGNRDFDVSDAAGQAAVTVKSLARGRQIVHAKVRDNGIGGVEGGYLDYNSTVQWYDADVATFDDPTTGATNEALVTGSVGTPVDATLHVLGLLTALDSTVADPAQQTAVIDQNLDSTFDESDATALGGILLVNASETLPYTLTTATGDVSVTGAGGSSAFDWNQDGLLEPFSGVTGVYVPLAGKAVSFAVIDSQTGSDFDGLPAGPSVGNVTPATATTDEAGSATATLDSTADGPETIEAVVDWAGNPHNLEERARAFAKTTWSGQPPAAPDHLHVLDGTLTEGAGFTVPADTQTDVTLHAVAHDQFGNEFPDCQVTFALLGQGTLTPGFAGSPGLYQPYAHFVEESPAHDQIVGGGLVTTFDGGPGFDANPLYEGTESTGPGTDDDDYARGWTNGVLTGEAFDASSGAYVTLRRDDTVTQMLETGGGVFRTLVNVTVGTSGGSPWWAAQVQIDWQMPAL